MGYPWGWAHTLDPRPHLEFCPPPRLHPRCWSPLPIPRGDSNPRRYLRVYIKTFKKSKKREKSK